MNISVGCNCSKTVSARPSCNGWEFWALTTLYILHLSQQTPTRNSGVYEFDSFLSSAGIHVCPTSTPETVCSSRRVVELTLKLTKETIAFVKKTIKLQWIQLLQERETTHQRV
jgi:hypothetical protein